MTFFKRPARVHVNQRTKCLMGYNHKSKAEASMCDHIMQPKLGSGEIQELVHEPKIYLGPKRHGCHPDWKVINKLGETEFYEFKGDESQGRWPKTKKTWKQYGPAPMHVYHGDARRQVFSYTVPVGIPPKLPKSHKDWLSCRQCSVLVGEAMKLHESHYRES